MKWNAKQVLHGQAMQQIPQQPSSYMPLSSPHAFSRPFTQQNGSAPRHGDERGTLVLDDEWVCHSGHVQAQLRQPTQSLEGPDLVNLVEGAHIASDAHIAWDALEGAHIASDALPASPPGTLPTSQASKPPYTRLATPQASKPSRKANNYVGQIITM